MGKLICAFFLLALSTTVSAQQFDVVLEGGQVMDPETGANAVRNVGIRDGRIARAARAGKAHTVESNCIIDRGRSVTPTAAANLPCAAIAWRNHPA
jgi:adenine deaminase